MSYLLALLWLTLHNQQLGTPFLLWDTEFIRKRGLNYLLALLGLAVPDQQLGILPIMECQIAGHAHSVAFL